MKLHVLLIISMIFLGHTELFAQSNDSPPVKKLKEIYTGDKQFQKVIKGMFENLQDLPDGSANPWKGRNINDLYDFLNEWFYFLPNTHNGLDRIIEFSFLYYNNPDGMKFVLEEPGLSWTISFVEERGKFMDSPESLSAVREWLKDESIRHDDFQLPKDGFVSFNHFFTRNLKPGARSVDAVADNSVLVSPADGVINMIANDLKLSTKIPTKGRMSLDLNALLNNSDYAEKFVGGSAVAVFLMPDNYHHYHAPVSGTIVESGENAGDRLFGMPDILDMINKGNPGYNKDYSVLENFRHGYFIIKTEDYGYVGMIPIGLQTIGSVVFEEKFNNISNENEVQVLKGEKLGHFAYGGSTVLLIFEKGRFNAVSVQQGQQIGNLKK